MSRIRHAGENITVTTKGKETTYAKGNIELHSNKKVNIKGEEKGISLGKPQSYKPKTDLLVTKVEGPYDETNNLVKIVKMGVYYTYKASLNREPKPEEIKMLRWATKNDDGKINELTGVSAHNGLKEKKILIGIAVNEDCEKARIYAYYKKVSEKVSVEVNIMGNIYFLLYTSGNKRGDEMFKAAALTRKYDLENSKVTKNNDKIFFMSFQDLYSLKSIIENNSKEYLVKEIDVWSHAAPDGPTGTKLTTSYALDSKQMTLEGWSKIVIDWSNNSEVNFFGCKTAIANKTFAKNLSSLNNFKDAYISGQTNSAYPSQYTNFRVNSENGEDNFINSEKDNKIVFQNTYMVAGIGRTDDWNLNEQNVALPMHKYKSGKSLGTNFQKGKTK